MLSLLFRILEVLETFLHIDVLGVTQLPGNVGEADSSGYFEVEFEVGVKLEDPCLSAPQCDCSGSIDWYAFDIAHFRDKLDRGFTFNERIGQYANILIFIVFHIILF